MLDALTDKLGAALTKLSGRGRITEANVQEAMGEVRTALIEGETSGEPRPFNPSDFKKRMLDAHG